MASMSSSTPPKQRRAALVLPDDRVSLPSHLPDELSIRSWSALGPCGFSSVRAWTSSIPQQRIGRGLRGRRSARELPHKLHLELEDPLEHREAQAARHAVRRRQLGLDEDGRLEDAVDERTEAPSASFADGRRTSVQSKRANCESEEKRNAQEDLPDEHLLCPSERPLENISCLFCKSNTGRGSTC
jgi:hypothetical protein